MIHHDQSILHRQDWKHGDPDPVGDCFRTCIACLLDLPLDAVPHFVDLSVRGGDHYFTRLCNWLSTMGMSAIEIDMADLAGKPFYGSATLFIAAGGRCIISGVSPRSLDGTGMHSCVGEDFKITHDPHPSRAGLVGTYDDWKYLFFIKKH